MNEDRSPIADARAAHLRLLGERWLDVEGARDRWSPQFTPGLPVRWPPRGRPTRLAWYGFAYRLPGFPDAPVSDAVEVSRPWGRVEQRGSGDRLQYTSLSPRVESLDLQGVRPLEPHEVQLLDELSLLERVIAQARSKVFLRSRHAAAYACWLSANGTIAAELPSIHDSFLDWVRSR